MKGSLCRLAETSFLWRDTAMRIRERFNPRAPCGARRAACPPAGKPTRHFNPRAPCGARRWQRRGARSRLTHFNPRAPCGARHGGKRWTLLSFYFNPRAPCGARPLLAAGRIRNLHFNPRAPCGARRHHRLTGSCDMGISTHAPLAGRDRYCLVSCLR